MKSYLFVLVILISGLRLSGQTNLPVRLALISESADASPAADVLTAELSGHKNLQLLERNEIEKVYREQGLSAGNKDYVKLGQILGADGLLLLESVEENTNQPSNLPFAAEKPLILNVRLVASKPGVVLVAERFSLLMKDLPDWSTSFSKHLNLFLPKLTVMAKDAIPISVVNLRSAVSSADASTTEHQLKVLTIERLSREPQLFVLERQRMELLAGEKELHSDESAFWNGSYLLDGVVDQNGYSKEDVTINARLTPPKGGQPLLFEVSGSRTNLAEVVNRLAVKLSELLKVNSASKEWNAADEAEQYFNEAQWALRWGIFAEAQTAAESACALGKKDLECAQLRVSAYMADLPEVLQPNFAKYLRTPGYRFVHINQPPDVRDSEMATRALECYYEFCRTSSDGEPRILSGGGNGRRKSDWYQLGIDVLTSSSSVLRHFDYFPESQAPISDKLANLRALARSVAALILKSPSVNDSYFVGSSLVSPEEFNQEPFTAWINVGHIRFYRGLTPNIFECIIQWGCFWQERPEETVALYRELMASPLFFRIHSGLWFREADFPRLVAWNEEDKKRIPEVWRGFMDELDASTNSFCRFEGEAFACADAKAKAWAGKDSSSVGIAKIVAADPGWKESRAALLDFISTNYEAIVENNDNLAVNDWAMGSLLGEKSEYASRFAAIQQAYRNKAGEHLKESASRVVFETQKRYLESFKPYDRGDFNKVFNFRDYTKAQATELQPLVAAYKSNLLAQVSVQTPQIEQIKAKSNARWIGVYLEGRVNAALNPPVPVPQPPVPSLQQTPPVISQPTLTARSKATNLVSNQTPEVVTNVLLVKKFLPIPMDGLPGDKISGATITAHHWVEGKLLLDFQYGAFAYAFDEKGNWKSTRNVTFPAIAILDPASEHWQVISCPEAELSGQNHFYHRSTLLNGELFVSDSGQIKKYDSPSRQWQVLPVSDGNNYELFTVSGRLYAANENAIFEIIDGGKSSRILASARRQPPVSALDTHDLGKPSMFEGPGHSLRVSTRNGMFTWTGNDWREEAAKLQGLFPPQIFTDGILFQQPIDGIARSISLCFLAADSSEVKLCLCQKAGAANRLNFAGANQPAGNPIREPEPLWKLPPNLRLAGLPAATWQSNLYLLVDHSEAQNIVDEQRHVIVGEKLLAHDGYHAALLCFSPEMPSPQKLFLKFEVTDGCPPVAGTNRAGLRILSGLPPAWMIFSTDFLFCGIEKSDRFMPAGTGSSGCNPGIWMIPLGQIESAAAAQKKVLLAQLAQKKSKASDVAEQARKQKEQAQRELLAKGDRNHNGMIDPDEREDALDAPAFIESELDNIDTNHNGWLEAPELAYFDANQNKTLDPQEQAGIDIAQHLLAVRLLKQFGSDDEDGLNGREYYEMILSTLHANSHGEFELQFPHADENHDSQVGLEELEHLLKWRTNRELLPRGMRGPVFNSMGNGVRQPADPRQMFKADVETYWQNPGGVPHRPSFRNGMPSGAGWVPQPAPRSATE
ncbi:MAG TPA: hypothetical protein VNN22_13125 [Verrucomicrobiae bacterium]|nr:hypothetical protein [Verrucomicrobiae bacterium]